MSVLLHRTTNIFSQNIEFLKNMLEFFEEFQHFREDWQGSRMNDMTLKKYKHIQNYVKRPRSFLRANALL